jgi:hypothetical protein
MSQAQDAKQPKEGWFTCAMARHVRADGSTEWQIHRGAPVDAQEIPRVQAAIRLLEEDSEQRQLNLVLANFKSFFAYWHALPQEWQRARQEAVNPVLRLQTELATRLFNWLQSLRAYLDHTQRRLDRRYGNDSIELASFKEATAKEFDQHFEYRFAWKLRNYGHVDFPALNLNINQSAPIGKPPQMKADVTFRRDVLLANFDEWGPAVREDLERQPEEFSVVPILVGVMESLDRIKAVVAIAEYPDLVDAVGVLDEMRGRAPEEEGSATLIRIKIDPDGQPTQAQMISIPPFQLPEEPPEWLASASSDISEDQTGEP